MSVLYTPTDNDEMRDAYGTRFGVCGPTVLAVLERATVKEIVDRWPNGYRGYAPMVDVKKLLGEFGWSYKFKSAHKSKEFPTPDTDLAIVRIQWLKDDGTEYFWAEATLHTHYVLMARHEGQWWVYCNGDGYGWFLRDSPDGKDYLDGGFVTSYLELTMA